MEHGNLPDGWSVDFYLDEELLEREAMNFEILFLRNSFDINMNRINKKIDELDKQ